MDDIQSLIEELRFGAENGADAELLERAADKIQEIVADLGDADAMTEYWMKKNKWILCEDRLPEARGTYLTVDMGTEFPHVRTLDYSAKWHGWNCVESSDDEQEAKKWEMNVTHWMALPDLPEVDV